jgi:hypothetical protein
MGILNARKRALFRPFQSAVFGALLLLASVTGCVPTFDDDLSLVQTTEVLAVQSEPAEAAPGDQVQLTALAAIPEVNGAAPRLTWGLCLARKPLTELGPVNPLCIEAPNLAPDSIVALGSGVTVMATLPTDACRLFGPSLPEPMNGEPAGRPVDPDPTGGYYQPVGVTLLANAVTTLGAVRIFCPPTGLDQDQSSAFTASYRRNENPSLASIASLDDSGAATPVPDEPDALNVSPGQVVHFEASWAACSDTAACSGAESYAWFDPDSRQIETQHESIRISWYATAGRFEDAVTGRDETEFSLTTSDDSWTAPTHSGEVRVWLVIRDSRGGQSFRTFVVSVKP